MALMSRCREMRRDGVVIETFVPKCYKQAIAWWADNDLTTTTWNETNKWKSNGLGQANNDEDRTFEEKTSCIGYSLIMD